MGEAARDDMTSYLASLFRETAFRVNGGNSSRRCVFRQQIYNFGVAQLMEIPVKCADPAEIFRCPKANNFIDEFT
jgi:hypothetical protein